LAITARWRIELEPRISEYLSLMMRLIFAFGLAFELPVILLLLARAGLVTHQGLAEKRKIAIVVSFVVAAILDTARCDFTVAIGLFPSSCFTNYPFLGRG
jgi:Sec-independent protein secretion pathway component TatC